MPHFIEAGRRLSLIRRFDAAAARHHATPRKRARPSDVRREYHFRRPLRARRREWYFTYKPRFAYAHTAAVRELGFGRIEDYIFGEAFMIFSAYREAPHV